ncbi:hypothetical protein, partial [Muriicola sp.]|uniref:hypothetical protein n=1 Tax=Muriicola sp. TaxID=2020856 RepID=UPI003C72649B
MITRHASSHPNVKFTSSNFEIIFRRFFTLILLFCFCFAGHAQWKKNKNKKDEDITISSCILDMGNGMYRVNFSYNNPNDKVIWVPKFLSRVVIKKKARWGRRRVVSFGINRFQPGQVENAFFVEFYDKEYVRWTLKNPKGKLKRTTANSNS